ncbi:proline-rich protein 23D1-like [Callithrix jacchus]|uniref:proline-rich protein 23D1-like n=1 Tax=Callithrix jacchus TaxID=9483 RepID=UPI0004F09258|nr:proline-rich protein 23D1-like [Callithrix jacchus]
MKGSRRPRSPSDSCTVSRSDHAGASSSSSTQSNAPKRQKVEELDPQPGAEPAPVQPGPHHPAQLPLEPLQGPQLPQRKVIIVVLEPGIVLRLSLGEEVLVLDPEGALQFSLLNVLLLVVPEQALVSLKVLSYLAQARWLLLGSAETVWQIDIENASVRVERAEYECAAPSVEEGEAPQGYLPTMGPPSNLVHGISPPSRHILYLKPYYGAPVPQGSSQMPKPGPLRRALLEELQLDLHVLEFSPSQGPRIYHGVLRRPKCTARRRLF